MNKNDFLIELDELLELDEGTLIGGENLTDFEEWDSLGVISFIALADEHFDIVINGDDLIASNTISDLINLVDEHFTT